SSGRVSSSDGRSAGFPAAGDLESPQAGLRRDLVLVEQAAQPVVALDAAKRGTIDEGRWAARWRALVEAAVWPMVVVVARVLNDDALQVSPAEDQDRVETFPPQRPDPPLRVRV